MRAASLMFVATGLVLPALLGMDAASTMRDPWNPVERRSAQVVRRSTAGVEPARVDDVESQRRNAGRPTPGRR
jgi:hypothetical protein